MASGCSRLTASYCSRTGTGFRVGLVEYLAAKLPGGGVLDGHAADGPRLGTKRRGPDDHAVLPRPTGGLPLIRPLDKHLDGLAQPALVGIFRNPPLCLEQNVDPAFLLGRCHIIRLPGRRRARSW